MELIVKSIIAALCSLVLIVVIAIQRNALIETKKRAESAEKIIRNQGDTIAQLMVAATKSKQAAAKLQAHQERIAATLSERERHIESLQHDNLTIRTWADAPLPDAIVGMRQHPAIIGAASFTERLSNADAVQSISGSTDD